MAVTILKRGCHNVVYSTLPGHDDTNVISNIEIVTGDYIEKTRDVSFKVIVELDKNIQTTPLFHEQDDEIATIDFCIRVELTIPELDNKKNVSVNFRDVEYRAKLKKVEEVDYGTNLLRKGWWRSSPEYELLSSLTGRNAISSEL